jgi:hypothetical protein
MRGQQMTACPRPAIAALIVAMERLSRRKRIEIALLGRKAPAAKDSRIRRLTFAAAAEARKLQATQWP